MQVADQVYPCIVEFLNRHDKIWFPHLVFSTWNFSSIVLSIYKLNDDSWREKALKILINIYAIRGKEEVHVCMYT